MVRRWGELRVSLVVDERGDKATVHACLFRLETNRGG